MNQDSLKRNKNMKIGAILSYMAIAINIISGLIYSPWMLSKIGDGDYGLYTLAVSLINMFLLDFGISSAVTRFVSKYVAESEQEKVNNFLGVIYKLFLSIAALISVVLFVLYFFIDNIYVSLTPDEISKFKTIYIIAASFSVLSFPLSTTLNGILTSYEKFVQMKLCDVLNKVITVGLVVLAILFGYGLYALVTINAAVNLLIFLVKMIIIGKTTPIKINFLSSDIRLLKEVFGFSVWVLLNSICSRLTMSLGPSVMGITCGTATITYFSFAAALEGYTYTFASAIDGMFMPKIARIVYHDKKIDELLPLMIRVGRFQFCLVSLIVIGFTCVGKDFIHLWLGSEYYSVYYGAVLLMLPAPFYLSQQIGKSSMVMLNQVRYLTYINVFKALVNLSLMFILSIFFGVIGACASVCIAYFVRNIANMVVFKKKLGINMKAFCFDCYGKMMLAMIPAIVIGVLMRMFYPNISWLHLIIKGSCFFLIYIASMWIIALSKQEKNTISGMLGGLVRKIRRKQ